MAKKAWKNDNDELSGKLGHIRNLSLKRIGMKVQFNMETTGIKLLQMARQSYDYANQVLWTVFSIFTAAQMVLLQTMYEKADCLFKLLLGAGIGVALSIIWLALLKRAIAHLRRWEFLCGKIEYELNIPIQFATSIDLNQQDYASILSDRNFGAFEAVRTMQNTARLAIGLWGLAFQVFLIRDILCLNCHPLLSCLTKIM